MSKSFSLRSQRPGIFLSYSAPIYLFVFYIINIVNAIINVVEYSCVLFIHENTYSVGESTNIKRDSNERKYVLHTGSKYYVKVMKTGMKNISSNNNYIHLEIQ